MYLSHVHVPCFQSTEAQWEDEEELYYSPGGGSLVIQGSQDPPAVSQGEEPHTKNS